MTVAVAFAILPFTAILGQTQSTPGIQLTLTQAIELALKQNPEAQIAALDAAYSEAAARSVRSELLPHVSVDSSDSISRFNLRALIGVDIPGLPHSIGPYQSIYAGTSFSTPLVDLSLLRNYQAAGQRVRASRSDERSVREQTVLLAVSEYMAHLRALASTAAAESRIRLAVELVKQAEDLRTNGLATKIDVSRAEVRLREEQQLLVDAQRDVQTSLFAIKRILNLANETAVSFEDADEFFRTPDIDLTNPIETALAQRPELSSLASRERAAAFEHSAALAKSLPTLRFSGRWNEQGPTLSRITPGYEYRFDLQLPLFVGGKLKADRDATSIALLRRQQETNSARSRVIEQAGDGVVELRASREQVSLAREQVTLAKDEVVLSRGRFAAGVTDNIEVIAAQDALANANNNEIGALYGYNIARAQLARAVGSVEQIYRHP